MNVLIIIPKLCNGGIEKVASNFSLNLPKEYKQTIYSIMDQNESYDFLVEPIILKKKLGNGMIGKFITFTARLRYIRKIIKSQKIDVCISFGERCNLINMLSLCKVKRILTIHSQLSIENAAKGKYGAFSTFLARNLYKKSDAIIAVSNIVKKDVVAHLKIKASKIDVIYNGHNLTEICEKASREKVLLNDYFVSVGRITYAKGHYHLLRSLALVKKEYPNVKLMIVGDYEEGNLKPLLYKLIDKYDLYENVTFVGFTQNPYPYILNSKALVLSSVFEGFPGVVIESLSLGVPVIATNCGGGTEVIFDGFMQSDTENNISQFGIITPKVNGVYDLDADISSSELKLAEAMINILDGMVVVDSNALIEKSFAFDTKSMIDGYINIIKKICK